MLAALSRLAEEPPPGMPTIIMACTVNEEHGYSGAADLEKLWQDGTSGSIIPRRPDACVVAEPTNLDVVVAHKGAVRWRVHTHGRAGHSSQPDLGDNAVYKMARVLAALENYHLEVAPRFPEHPLCGPATLSVGTIHGGLSVNTIPDLCTIEVDRRLLPGEKNDEVYRHVVDYVANYPGIDFEVDHERPFLDGSALSNDNNGPLAERLASVVQRLYGHGQKIGVPFGTDASKIAAAGVPSVVFGPGSINQAHTADEWLSLDELAKAADVLYEFGKAGL